MAEILRRGDVFPVNLDPTRGGEIQKARPCVGVSPDELNDHLRTFIVAPLTTGRHPYPFRIPCRFEGGRVTSFLTKFVQSIASVWCENLESCRHPR